MPRTEDILSLLKSYEPTRHVKQGVVSWQNPKLETTTTRNIELLQHSIVGIKTARELANLLEVPVGQLLFILYKKKDKYKEFSVKKKSGKERIIDAPCSSLQILQRKVLPLIEPHYRVKKPVHGFVGGGKGIISNAEQHKKKNYVLNIDLKDFFHSVNFGRVRGIFLKPPFSMGTQAATVLAQLCTHNGRLPQGACTSPIISNLAATHLDKALVKLASNFQLTYTRYADDLTFSSNQKFPSGIVEHITETKELAAGRLLEKAVNDAGFEINTKKTRLAHKSQRQEVTGLIVNSGVNVNRQFIRKTRAMINEWSKNLLEAEVRYLKTRFHVKEEDLNRDRLDGSIFKSAVYGNLSFIRQIRGEEHSPYLSFCKKILELDASPPPFIRKMKEVLEMYDVFICHASEDKKAVALPLYEALNRQGVKAFIDCFEIRWGDSLVSRINTALKKSKYVIAIISDESVKKSWPMKEVHSVLASEIDSSETKLLPLIVGDSESLMKELPLLQDKVFQKFENNEDDIADIVKSLLSK